MIPLICRIRILYGANCGEERSRRAAAESEADSVRGEIICDGAEAAAGYELHVFSEHTRAITKRGRFPLRTASRKFFGSDVEIDAVCGGLDRDFVTFVNEGNAAAYSCFRSYVADNHSIGAAGKAAVGNECDGIAEAGTNQSGSGGKHFAHARAAFRTFVANHDYVAGLNFFREDRLQAVFF